MNRTNLGLTQTFKGEELLNFCLSNAAVALYHRNLGVLFKGSTVKASNGHTALVAAVVQTGYEHLSTSLEGHCLRNVLQYYI